MFTSRIAKLGSGEKKRVLTTGQSGLSERESSAQLLSQHHMTLIRRVNSEKYTEKKKEPVIEQKFFDEMRWSLEFERSATPLRGASGRKEKWEVEEIAWSNRDRRSPQLHRANFMPQPCRFSFFLASSFSPSFSLFSRFVLHFLNFSTMTDSHSLLT